MWKWEARRSSPSLASGRGWVVEKGISVTPPTSVTEPLRTASPTTSLEEITPIWKKPRLDKKGKDKADSSLSTIFDDVGLELARAQEYFSAEELRVFSGVPSHEVVGRHIHKLVQVLYLHNFTLFFFFLLLHRSEFQISFSGAKGESSHYFWVPYSRSQNCVGGVQDGGSRGRKL